MFHQNCVTCPSIRTDPGIPPPGYSATPRTRVYGPGISTHTGAGDTVWQPILNLYNWLVYNLRKVLLTGVPRGYILWPLLLFIRMNDSPLVTNYFTFIIHADGTTLFINYSILLNPSNLKWSLINGGFLKVKDWFETNRVCLTASKIHDI